MDDGGRWTTRGAVFALVLALVGVTACVSRRPAPEIQALPSSVAIATGTAVTMPAATPPVPANTAAVPTFAAPPAVETATITPGPTLTPLPVTPVGTPAVTTAAVKPVERINALVLGGTQVRSQPSMSEGDAVATLGDHAAIMIEGEVRGQRWVVGNQTWAMAFQDWSSIWYKVRGGYVYAGFVYVARPGEAQSLSRADGEHWIDINVDTQRVRAMIDDQPVFTAFATTGKPGFDTPTGTYVLPAWGRKFNETMTSAQAGIRDPREHYDVHNVLYTQYFDESGDALHLNYWQPESVFGNQRTSHGCVGLQLHDAQYLWLFARPGMRVVIHSAAGNHPISTATPARPTTPVPSRTAPAALSPVATTPVTASASVSPTPVATP